MDHVTGIPVISHRQFFLKRVFPVIWFGMVAVVAVGGLAATLAGNGIGPFLMMVPTIMAGIGYVMFRALVLDLVDEVADAGDSLIIRNRGQTIQVSLADVINVDSSPFMNPPRIVLTLRSETKLGRKIAFSPKRPFTLNPFADIPITEELVDRIDRARRRRTI